MAPSHARLGGWIVAMMVCGIAGADEPQPLPGAQPLRMEGDISAKLVEGVDRFLLKQIEKAAAEREKFWKRDTSSVEAYNKSIEPNRQRLRQILGLRDPRPPFDAPELVGTTDQPARVGKGEGFEVYAVRWPAVGSQKPEVQGSRWPLVTTIHGEGLLLVPTGREPIADVVAIPHCDQTPEQIVGLVEGVPPESQYARRLAESGCRVIVPMLINRQEFVHGISNREFLYRSAFELGRHLISYELQKVLAAIDWFEKSGATGGLPASAHGHERENTGGQAASSTRTRKIGVIGYGDGGMLALYAGALDTRIDTTVISGYFGNCNDFWQQPIDRNVFGLVQEFDQIDLEAMVVPRGLVIETSRTPEASIQGVRGAPATIAPLDFPTVTADFTRLAQRISAVQPHAPVQMTAGVLIANGSPFFGVADRAMSGLLEVLGIEAKLSDPRPLPDSLRQKAVSPLVDRHTRQFAEIDNHNQLILREAQYVRDEFIWNKLDYSSVDAYSKSIEPFRQKFRDEVIGKFDEPLLPFNARSRKTYDKDKWTGYEVVLDVWPDVIAYGVLLLPKDLKPGEKRPVVVCQHGLEGRPRDVIEGKGHAFDAYHDFAAKLAERGFITFAPQNLYVGQDRFRTLQRKANPLGKTLFSIIVPQHQQIVNWLKTLPQVDGSRIGFYGLSYGGKSAMRIPALVTDYALSICSADFNEWVDKNASTRGPYSYVWTNEYEIFEWDLGSTFNYAEMAALICPRPFMVERGHFDGVGLDQNVAWEYAKIRHLYSAKLHIPDKTRIEWFPGPHMINGKGTFAFLHKHLRWPERQ